VVVLLTENIKLVPDSSGLPPVLLGYHQMLSPLAAGTALMVALPGPQMLAPVTEVGAESAGNASTHPPFALTAVAELHVPQMLSARR
jgi:hypothetical protein